jgi:hypothetical protein
MREHRGIRCVAELDAEIRYRFEFWQGRDALH